MLETLKDVKEIGGFKLIVMDELREKYPDRFTETGAMDHVWFETTIRPNHFVYVRHDKNSIAFTIQDGPIKEVGVNGCQVDTVIETAKVMIQNLDKKFSCLENKIAVSYLNAALATLEVRRKTREARGVEGTSQA